MGFKSFDTAHVDFLPNPSRGVRAALQEENHFAVSALENVQVFDLNRKHPGLTLACVSFPDGTSVFVSMRGSFVHSDIIGR